MLNPSHHCLLWYLLFAVCLPVQATQPLPNATTNPADLSTYWFFTQTLEHLKAQRQQLQAAQSDRQHLSPSAQAEIEMSILTEALAPLQRRIAQHETELTHIVTRLNQQHPLDPLPFSAAVRQQLRTLYQARIQQIEQALGDETEPTSIYGILWQLDQHYHTLTTTEALTDAHHQARQQAENALWTFYRDVFLVQTKQLWQYQTAIDLLSAPLDKKM